jgi:PIN domain nuclease of toxin-antitoxin system
VLLSVAGIEDTHTALWYLYRDARLSAAAKAFIDRAQLAGDKIGVSSISLIEIVYLVEKQRVISSAYEDLMAVLTDPSHVSAYD